MVLFVHGGFWRNQDRRYHQTLVGLYGNVGAALAQRGIGVAVQSYRLSPQVGIKEQLSDVLAATKWVLANSEKHGGDASALVLAGYSAGGIWSRCSPSIRATCKRQGLTRAGCAAVSRCRASSTWRR